MAAKTGDFLLLNYTLRVKESGQIVETTFDSVAKEAEIHKEGVAYGPRFVILGEGWFPKGLEDSLLGLDAGRETTIELLPEKGYGTRDPGKMRLVSLRRFREKGIDPVPGLQVEFEGRTAVVRAVGAGRVQVDYNHPLAGRTLVYTVQIEKVLEEENEKILNILSRRIPEVSSEKFGLNRESGNLTVEVPEEAFYISGLQVAKKAVTSDIQKFLPDINDISFLETFQRGRNRAETEPSPETTPPQPQSASEARPRPSETPDQQTPRKPEPRSGARATAPKRRRRSGSENQR